MVKLSTKKILGLELTLTAVLLGSLWVPQNVVRSYLQVAALAGTILLGVALLGWARVPKANNRLFATIIILAATVYQAVTFVLLGWSLGFVSNVYALNWASILRLFLPMIAMIVLAEIWRGQMLEKGKNSRTVIIVTTLVLTFVGMVVVLPSYSFGDVKAWFDGVVTLILPGLLTNILLSIIAYYYDYRINIAYRLLMELPIYVLPIYPDVSPYLGILLQTFLVMVLVGILLANRSRRSVATELAYNRPERAKRILNTREQNGRKLAWGVGGGALLLVTVLYAGLMSGLFKYYFLAIGSGSMMPKIARGDLVLVEKNRQYHDLKEGDILVYRHDDATVVHRIEEIREEDGRRSFITKGDANASADNWIVTEADVIGTVKGRLVGMGYPTIWLSEPLKK